MEETSPLKIGLIPFERPINIVREETKLLLSLNQELVKPGSILELTIESGTALQSLELILPTGEKILLQNLSQNSWNYRWQVPGNIPTGQVKVKCTGVDLEGNVLQAEALLVIIPK